MGTYIDLTVGGISVDECKNSRGYDHGALFQEDDRKRLRSDHIDYDHIEHNDPSLVNMELAFSRPLRAVIPRLDLLGFRLEAVSKTYQIHAKQWLEDRAALAGDDEPLIEPMTFEEFLSFVQAHPIRDLADSKIRDVDEAGERRVRGR